MSNFTPRRKATVGSPLTRREEEVLILASHGRQMKHIARDLGVSYYTVVGHYDHIRTKMACHNITHAVAEALRKGIIR